MLFASAKDFVSQYLKDYSKELHLLFTEKEREILEDAGFNSTDINKINIDIESLNFYE